MSIRPLAPATNDSTPAAVTASVVAWIGSIVIVLGIGGVVVSSLAEVRSLLESSTAHDNPNDSSAKISDAVTLLLGGSGGIALILVLTAVLSLQVLRTRKSIARTIALVVGIISVACGLEFRSLFTSAADIAGGTLNWGPLAYCALVAVAALTPFAPGVSAWLGRQK